MKTALFSLCFLTTALFSTENTDKIASAAYQSYENQSKNWIFSPFSMSACLSMIYAGSDGRTAEELKEALHTALTQDEIGPHFQSLSELLIESSGPGDFSLSMAQGLWIQNNFSFLDPFLKGTADHFHAQIEEVASFTAKIPEINGWIAKETQGKIQNLFSDSDLDESTRLVAANALYFQGNWIYPFSGSHPAPFTSSSGKTETVTMMHQTNQFLYFEDETLQAILLPFTSKSKREPVCLLVLPKKPISLEKIDQILDSMQPQLVRVEVPKFEFDTRIDLESMLKEWGVSDAFSPRADFSRMDGRMDLFLSKVLQKSFISFNEKGVEAAAATAAAAGIKCCPPSIPTVEFIADRPFEFLIIEKTSHTTLFVGHVETP
jgi:serpin B